MKPYYERDHITIYCGDNREVLPTLAASSIDFACTDPPYGLSFMGHEWDHGVPGVPYWDAIQRVCKPGALMLAFGGTRTYHRLTCAIEDAGWEIRDCLMWLYGQGFPKAPDIGVLIDKVKGVKREVVGTKLGQPGYSLADNGRTNEVYGDLHNPAAECAITAPATELAKQWTGWANALKPAWEPIILAMKPLDGTLAHNAERWSVAGLNIHGGRIGSDSTIRTRSDSITDAGGKSAKRSPVVGSASGRWPANLLLDTEAAGLLDEQTGGASRFFYVAKTTKKERSRLFCPRPRAGWSWTHSPAAARRCWPPSCLDARRWGSSWMNIFAKSPLPVWILSDSPSIC
jgi:site-specific DNA-methyltransferase (adenine-specific)